MKKDVNTLADMVDLNQKIDRERNPHVNSEDRIKGTVTDKHDSYDKLVRDLHDTLQQTLLVLNMKLQKAKIQFPDGHDSQVIDESLEYSRVALKQIKTILSDEDDVRDTTLNDQLCQMVKNLSSAVDFKITIDNAFKSDFPKEKSSEMLKVVDEILTNAIKYSNAQNLRIQLHENKKAFFVTIKDDGVGFELNTVREGHGFKNIRHRIDCLGGTVYLESDIGKGTAVHMSLVK